jgi:FlaA1/EpsC-like NDP-sugar epimerase
MLYNKTAARIHCTTPAWSLADRHRRAIDQGFEVAALRLYVDRVFQLLVRFRGAVLISLHVLLFTAAFLLAYLIRFDGLIPASEWHLAVRFLPLLLSIKLSAFLFTGTHRGWCRYNSFADIVALTRTATLGSLGVFVAAYLLGAGTSIPRSVVTIDLAGTILLLASLRGGLRLLRERHHPWLTRTSLRPVLIVDASDTGLALARELRAQPQLGMKVVGFLDEYPKLRGRVLGGIPVLGTPAEVRRHAERRGVRTVLVPTPTVPPRVVRTLVEACAGTDVDLQIIPGFDALVNGCYDLQPREVDINDLLCREPVQLDNRSVESYIDGRTVLVTGAAGSIGSELCRQILAFGPRRIVLLDHSENGLFYVERELRERAGAIEIVAAIASITDSRRLRTLLQKYRPEVVFHAAAHKHVPMMEINPGEAVKNNVLGTRTLVNEAVRASVEAFVMISTDKAVNPTSVMGACKRAAEMYVQALSAGSATRLVTVRFGNVLGSNGSVVPLFKEQIRRGGPVTVTHPDMTRYFMTIPEATQLVLQAGALGRGGEIFVLDMGEPVRVLDMARDLIRLTGLTEGRDIQIAFTGLRPGEKLYEELYDDAEERLSTPHPKIFCAQHRPANVEDINRRFARLAEVVDGPVEAVLAGLAALVPEYRSQTSAAFSPAPASEDERSSHRQRNGRGKPHPDDYLVATRVG